MFGVNYFAASYFGQGYVATGPALNEDSAQVYLDLQAGSIDVLEAVDSSTVYFNLLSSGVELRESIDAATIYLDLQVQGGECFSQWSGEYLGEGEAWVEFFGDATAEWSGEATPEWSPGSPELEGAHC